MPKTLINLPNYYRFPFEAPTGYAEDILTEEVHPYHQVSNNFFAIFIKSHFRSVPSVTLGMTDKEFRSNYKPIENNA